MEDYRILQKDIDAIDKWIQNIPMQCNSSKSKFIVLSRKKNGHKDPCILLNGNRLKEVSHHKYLGVHIIPLISLGLCILAMYI